MPGSLETVAHTRICQSATLSGRDSSTNGGFPTRLQMFLLSGRRDVAALPGATVTYFLLQITTSCIFLRNGAALSEDSQKTNTLV